jgi:hypothetical protein
MMAQRAADELFVDEGRAAPERDADRGGVVEPDEAPASASTVRNCGRRRARRPRDALRARAEGAAPVEAVERGRFAPLFS